MEQIIFFGRSNSVGLQIDFSTFFLHTSKMKVLMTKNIGVKQMTLEKESLHKLSIKHKFTQLNLTPKKWSKVEREDYRFFTIWQLFLIDHYTWCVLRIVFTRKWDFSTILFLRICTLVVIYKNKVVVAAYFFLLNMFCFLSYFILIEKNRILPWDELKLIHSIYFISNGPSTRLSSQDFWK